MKLFRTILKKADSVARDYFAPFVIMDEMGTAKQCWTMREAMEWMPYCGKLAVIRDAYDHKPLVWRRQGV